MPAHRITAVASALLVCALAAGAASPALAAGAAASSGRAPARPLPLAAESWPSPWDDVQASTAIDFTPPRFEAPTASHCRQAPTTREVPGRAPDQQVSKASLHERSAMAASSAVPSDGLASARSRLAGATELLSREAARREARPTGHAGELQRQHAPGSPDPSQRPGAATVTAGVVDDNADFGEYLAYRRRSTVQAVRERDISERYLLEVTDAAGRPVHDAEVAVQRPGIREPVMQARTDTAGRVWLHPRAFLSPVDGGGATDGLLGVAVRKGVLQARARLQRGQAEAVQVRLGAMEVAERPRLDLVFMVDATGSMADEIGKLKASMRAMAMQIGALPARPDVCWALVAYRDRGDDFLTRTHDFTDDLGAFQGLLARVEAAGGGDTPEAVNEALQEVVHGLRWRRDAARLVVMVGDAPPHLDYGGPQYDMHMQAALAKGIKLFAVGASGLDAAGEYVFRQLAQYTSGRFVFLTYRDAADPSRGPGTQTVHDVKNYSVQTLDRLVVRLVSEELARLGRS